MLPAYSATAYVTEPNRHHPSAADWIDFDLFRGLARRLDGRTRHRSDKPWVDPAAEPEPRCTMTATAAAISGDAAVSGDQRLVLGQHYRNQTRKYDR